MLITKAQRIALKRIFDRIPSHGSPRRVCVDQPILARNYYTGQTYREFRKGVQPGPGCIMVHWHSMWLGIETDGYTHSNIESARVRLRPYSVAFGLTRCINLKG